MSDDHTFHTTLRWPADPAQEKPPVATFSRNSILGSPGHPVFDGGSPPVFGGVADRYNPEELMTLSLSNCHMLTFLALAAKKQVAVLAYEDNATGKLGKGVSGKTQMEQVMLRPKVTVARGTDLAMVNAMHEKAHAYCFMANSVNFPVENSPATVEG
jgi:organic hydroperoxide reductase OsmC/OhrA